MCTLNTVVHHERLFSVQILFNKFYLSMLKRGSDDALAYRKVANPPIQTLT